MNIKQNKGIGLGDAIVAVAILVIFTGGIISISYNIYIQSNFIKRNEQATNYIVEAFEYAKGLVYEDVEAQKIADYINNKNIDIKAIISEYDESAQTDASYTMFINMTDEYPEEYSKYIKKLDITIMYKLGGKIKTVNMETLINK